MARKTILESTIKKLFSLAHNECSFPKCPIKIAREDRDDFTVNICHIEAAEEGGQRYNPNMTDDERRHYDNLILLCTIHHTETNDEKKYSVQVLKEMKQNHHIKMLQRFSSEGTLTKYPSSLVEVINYLSSPEVFSEIIPVSSSDSFKIEEKIEYNSVKRYKPVIEEYRVYQGKLNQIYREIEEQGSVKKEFLLGNIKGIYVKAKGSVLGENDTIENIQNNADNLIEEVEKGLWNLVEGSNNLKEDLHYEAISLGVSIILVDAFMRCKILEEPPKNDN